MKDIKCLLWSLLLSCAVLHAAEVDKGVHFTTDPLTGLKRIYTNNPSLLYLHDKEVALLTPEDRAAIRGELAIQLKDSNYLTIDGASRIFIALGDETGIKLVMEAYDRSSGGGGNAIKDALNAGNLSLLPYVMEEVDHGSKEWVPTGTDFSPLPSLQFMAAEMIIEAIIRSEKFTPETRAWAEQARRRLGWLYREHYDLIYDQLKEWWAHNKTAILAQKYDQATWLPQDSPALLARLAAPGDPPVGPPPATHVPPAAVIPSVPASTFPSAYWLAGAAALAVLALGWRIFRRK